LKNIKVNSPTGSERVELLKLHGTESFLRS